MVGGMAGRVLAWRGGERHMTDLAHVGQVLHETAHREHFGLPALLEWLRGPAGGRSAPSATGASTATPRPSRS